MNKLKQYDKTIAIFFGILTLVFIYFMTREVFFEWAFRRHQNQLSWYSRPLFLIPFCYFAYKRSWAGVLISTFAMLSSMFWFPQPDEVSERVKEFLRFEREYLMGEWTLEKILLASTVPISLFFLALAFWKRNVWFGVTVIILMAIGKVIWSIYNAGEAGTSIIIPALIGLVLCIALIAFGYRRMNKSKNR